MLHRRHQEAVLGGCPQHSSSAHGANGPSFESRVSGFSSPLCGRAQEGANPLTREKRARWGATHPQATPVLRSINVFDEMRRRYPDLPEGVRRTLERRIPGRAGVAFRTRCGEIWRYAAKAC